MVSAAVLLWENLDVQQLSPMIQAPTEPPELPVPQEPSPPAAPAGVFTALIYQSPRNQSFFPDASHYSQALNRWRKLIESVGGRVIVVHSLWELPDLDQDPLLVIPEAPCLSEEELVGVRKHLASGGSILSNWAVGARDEACKWRGWGTVAELTGAEDVRELGIRDALYLAVPAGTPFSPGLDPGTRIEFRRTQVLALRIPGPRAYWADWALNPSPDESGGGADAAASATLTEMGGRTVWFGFQLSNVATTLDSARLRRMVQNGILWAAGRPVASLAPWPDGKRGALVLAQDVEAEHRNASAMAQLLREREVPGSFYVVSQLVLGDPELASVLLEAGEVGSHTSDHAPLLGLGPGEQRSRLKRGWSETEEWAGVAPAGLRPPEESFDLYTLRGWLEAGGDYLMATNQARSGAPEIYRIGGRSIVLLPRLLKDDYNVIVQDGAVRADRLTEAFLDGMGKMRAIGGLATVIVHTQIVGTGRRLDAIRTVVDTAEAQGDWWIARGDQVAAWWRARDAVTLTLSEHAPSLPSTSLPPDPGMTAPLVATTEMGGGFQLEVCAPADRGVGGIWVEILVPLGKGGLVPQVEGMPISYSVTDFGIRVPVGTLEAGATRRISLEPSPAKAGI